MNQHHSEAVVKRCEVLIQHLEAFPETFDMGRFIYRHEIDATHPCGTIGCLAGALVFLEYGPLSGKITHDEWSPENEEGIGEGIAARAIQLLEITEVSARSLFYVEQWPEDLIDEDQCDSEGEPNAALFTAADGIARIEHFLETGE